MVVKNYKIDFGAFLDFVKSFEDQNVRFLSFVLQTFDIFLAKCESPKQMREMRLKKLKFCNESLEKFDNEIPFELEEAF